MPARQLVTPIVDPATHVILDRKLFHRGPLELRFQGEHMGFERHAEMGFGLHEASHEQFGVALQAEQLKLHGVHECVEQRPLAERLIEDQDINEGQRIHVRDLRQIVETEGARLGIERWRGNAFAMELDDADPVQ